MGQYLSLDYLPGTRTLVTWRRAVRDGDPLFKRDDYSGPADERVAVLEVEQSPLLTRSSGLTLGITNIVEPTGRFRCLVPREVGGNPLCLCPGIQRWVKVTCGQVRRAGNHHLQRGLPNGLHHALHFMVHQRPLLGIVPFALGDPKGAVLAAGKQEHDLVGPYLAGVDTYTVKGHLDQFGQRLLDVI